MRGGGFKEGMRYTAIRICASIMRTLGEDERVIRSTVNSFGK